LQQKGMAKNQSKGASLEGEQDVAKTAEDQEKELLHEISILQSLRHPDLVMFLGACFESEQIMFITEYMPGGDLERYYQLQRKARQAIYRPPMRQLLAWARALLRALTFLHGCSRRIIHRDLKPLNLLLSQDLALKVADFGISKLTSSGFCSEYTRMTGGVGSLRYMAPEVVRHEQYTEKADIYSAALILYFMSSGRAPFHEHGKDPESVLQKFVNGEEPRPMISQCHQSLKRVVQDGWNPIAAQRPSASEMLQTLSNDASDTSVAVNCCLIA